MRNRIYLGLFFILLSAFVYGQDRIYINGNVWVKYDKVVELNKAQGVYIGVEWDLKEGFSKQDINLIEAKLKQDFVDSRVILNTEGNKICVLSDKTTIGKYQAITDYFKHVLVGLELYKGFVKSTEFIIELN